MSIQIGGAFTNFIMSFKGRTAIWMFWREQEIGSYDREHRN